MTQSRITKINQNSQYMVVVEQNDDQGMQIIACKYFSTEKGAVNWLKKIGYLNKLVK